MLIANTASSLVPKPTMRNQPLRGASQSGAEQGSRAYLEGGLARAEQVKANLPGEVVQVSERARRAGEEFLAQSGRGGKSQSGRDVEGQAGGLLPGVANAGQGVEGQSTGLSLGAAKAGREGEGAVEDRSDPRQLDPEEERVVRELAERDREVRVHEQAHAVAAGPYMVSGPHYEYQRGPDGKSYAIGGYVKLDTAPVPGDPEATVRKMTTLYRAALAPVNPSDTDRRIAAKVSAEKVRAQQEVTSERNQKLSEQVEQVRDQGLEEMSGAGEVDVASVVANQSPAVEVVRLADPAMQIKEEAPIEKDADFSGSAPKDQNSNIGDRLSEYATELLQMPAEIFASPMRGFNFATSRYLQVAGW